MGHQFEIILLDSPYTLRTGDWIKAKVLFQGKTLTQKIITARNRIGNKPATVAYSRTDDAGICKFKLKRNGDWFIHATHMIPCPDRQDSDWESFWSTYSFGIGDVILD